MLAVIGCGNLNRRDDGVGVVVARELMQRRLKFPAPQVGIFDAGTGGMEVMFRARGASRLVVIDAIRSGSEPGAIFRVPGEELARDYQPTFSLHDFRWEHALYAGSRIFGPAFPTDITVFLIEAASLDLGTQLSDAVRRAAHRVVDEIDDLIEQHLGRSADPTQTAPMLPRVRIARGSIYLDHALCERYLRHATSVALLQSDGRNVIVPLRGSSGGLLLKVLNACGDRVVHAEEFLSRVGIHSNSPEIHVAVRWCPQAAALILEDLVPVQTKFAHRESH